MTAHTDPDLLTRARLLCEAIDESPHVRGSINGMAAQLGYSIRAALAATPAPNPVHVALHSPATASGDKGRYALHRAVLDLPHRRTFFGAYIDPDAARDCYSEGHKDARHGAAELVLGIDVQTGLVEALRYHFLRGERAALSAGHAPAPQPAVQTVRMLTVDELESVSWSDGTIPHDDALALFIEVNGLTLAQQTAAPAQEKPE